MKRRALFIGVDNYEDMQIRNLNYAILDASSLKTVFEDLGYETDILQNPAKSDVLSTVRKMTWDLEQGDLFFFYFSGHGFSVGGKELLFCSDDQYEDLRYNYNVGIQFDYLEQKITDGGYNRVFMIDACRSDFLSGSRGSDFATRDLIPIGDMLKGASGTGSLAIMRSCSRYESSIEIDCLKHGLFTLAMLDILRQFRNAGKRLFFDGNLCTNIQTQMRKIAVENHITSPQTPEFTISGISQVLMEGNDIAVDAASAIQGNGDSNKGAEQLNTQKNNAIPEENNPHQDFHGSRQEEGITQAERDNPVEYSSQKEKSEANRRYEEAIRANDWNEARRAAAQLVQLDSGSMEQWNDKINYHIKQRRFTLEINCKMASDEFDKVFPTDIKAARVALDDMEYNWQLLLAEYNSTPTVNSIREGLEKRKSKLAAEESNQIVDELRAAEALKAEGSRDGKPVITLSWSPAEEGAQATKWLILRREKGVSPNVKELATVGTYTFIDNDENLKVGIEYEYGVIPVTEIETAGGKESRQNEKAISWSESVVCLASLSMDALNGNTEGDSNNCGVSLSWTLPYGLDSNCTNMKLTLTRDGGCAVDATKLNGHWEDRNVILGKEYAYSLALELFGRPMGSVSKRIAVRQSLLAPPPVENLSLQRSASGALEASWTWPTNLEACIWGTAGQQPINMNDLALSRRYKLLRPANGRSVVTLPQTDEGEQWLAVFGVRGRSGSEVSSAPRTLNISKTSLRYYIAVEEENLFTFLLRLLGLRRRAKTQLILEASSKQLIPHDLLEIHIGTYNDVLNGDGRIIDPWWYDMKEQENGWKSWIFPLDGKVERHEHVRLFLKNSKMDDNCEINHPDEDKSEVK